jgi:IS5 family transposase
MKEAKTVIITPPLIESADRPRTHIEAPPEDRAEHAAPDAPAPVIFRADNDARRVNKGHKSTQGEKGFVRCDEEGRG